MSTFYLLDVEREFECDFDSYKYPDKYRKLREKNIGYVKNHSQLTKDPRKAKRFATEDEAQDFKLNYEIICGSVMDYTEESFKEWMDTLAWSANSHWDVSKYPNHQITDKTNGTDN